MATIQHQISGQVIEVSKEEAEDLFSAGWREVDGPSSTTIDPADEILGQEQQGPLTILQVSQLLQRGGISWARAIELFKALGVTDPAKVADGILGDETGGFEATGGTGATTATTTTPSFVSAPSPVPQAQVVSPLEAAETELLRRSGTRGGRGSTFFDFLNRAQAGRPINRAFAGAQAGQFNPLSAQFLLQGIDPFLQGQTQPTFREFINQPRTAPFDFRAALSNIGGLFAQDPGPLSPWAQAVVSGLGGNRDVGQNLALQAILGGQRASGPFGQFLPDIVEKRFGALADIDPLVDPFTQFARQGFQF